MMHNDRLDAERQKFFHIDDPNAFRRTWSHVNSPDNFCQELLSRLAVEDVSETALRRALSYFFGSCDRPSDNDVYKDVGLTSGALHKVSFDTWLLRLVDSAARLLTIARMQPPHILFPSNPAQFQGTREFCHGVLANALLGNLAHDPMASFKRRSAEDQKEQKAYSSAGQNGLLDWTMALFPATTDIAYHKVLSLLQYFVTTASMHPNGEDDDDGDDEDEEDDNYRFWQEIVTFQVISNFSRSEFENLMAWDHIRIRSSTWHSRCEWQDSSIDNCHNDQQQQERQQSPNNVLHSITTHPMEDGRCSAMVDFANEVFGVGGFYALSASQEEIIQVTCPEFNVGMMCFGYLPDEGALIVRNVRRFSQYSGYGASFTFQGPLSNPFAQTFIVMDAINLNEIITDNSSSVDVNNANLGLDNSFQRLMRLQDEVHFSRDLVMRDLHKAYMGFLGAAAVDLSTPRRNNVLTASSPTFSEETKSYIISTGKWGCGAFGGNVILKFLQQVVAAYLSCGPAPSLTPSLAKQSSKNEGVSSVDDNDPYVCLRFSAYRDPQLQATLEQVYQACHGLTPRQVLNLILTEARHSKTLFYSENGATTSKLNASSLINLLRSIPR